MDEKTHRKLTQVECIVMQYAQNRIDMKAMNDCIKKLTFDENGAYYEIDLSPYRDEWLSSDYGPWDGWVNAIEYSETEKWKDEEMELAKLLDEKKKLRAECGNIKRKIYNIGKKMAKLA